MVVSEGGIGVYKKLQNRPNNNRKLQTEKTFDQNRKPQAKSEQACSRLRSLRRIFSEEKPEKHRTASDSKSENTILFLPKTENRERNRTETANRNSQQNRKTRVFLVQKPKNRSKKWPKPQTRRSQCPPRYCVMERFLIRLTWETIMAANSLILSPSWLSWHPA